MQLKPKAFLLMCHRFVYFVWQLAPYWSNILEIQSCYSRLLISYVAASFDENIQTFCSLAEASHKLSVPWFEENAIFPEPLLHCLGCVLIWSCWKGNLCPRMRSCFSLRWYMHPFSCPSTPTIVPYSKVEKHSRIITLLACISMVLARWWVVHGFSKRDVSN